MLLLNLLIALIWAGLVAEFTLGNLLLGFLLGYLAITLVSTEQQRHVYQAKAWKALRFAWFYLKEVVLSTSMIAWAIVRPIGNLHPAVVAVPLQPGASDDEVTAIANLITYTPGTLSIEIAPGNTHLYVHLFSSGSPEQQVTLIQSNYERRILELFR